MNAAIKLASASVLILLIPFIHGCHLTAEPQSGYVVFPDTNLESSVRNALFIEGMMSKDESLLMKPLAEEITVVELGKLTIMEAVGENITSLRGLEYCTNLKELYLSDNRIVGINELSSLKNLTRLDLGANQISDISPLASLDKLTVLDLYVNHIHNISPLASLTSLNKLYLFRNFIGDVSPLASLNNLTELDLFANRINDISALLENEGLGEGDIIRLAGNNLDFSKGSKDINDIEVLKGRGVVVVLQ